MDKAQKEFLITYEMPMWFDLVGVTWLQKLCSRYIAYQVNRKMARYGKRMERKAWLIKKGLI